MKKYNHFGIKDELNNIIKHKVIKNTDPEQYELFDFNCIKLGECRLNENKEYIFTPINGLYSFEKKTLRHIIKKLIFFEYKLKEKRRFKSEKNLDD